MDIGDILNLIALITIPIISVLISQLVQNRSEKRKDKMIVFKSLMTYRYGYSQEAVYALNSIPIVFSKDKLVRNCWKEYYNTLCVQNPNSIQLRQRDDALCKLLESMAKVLGYKDSITWEDIQNPYIPKGLVDTTNNNMAIQDSMAFLLQQMKTNHNGEKTIVNDK